MPGRRRRCRRPRCAALRGRATIRRARGKALGAPLKAPCQGGGRLLVLPSRHLADLSLALPVGGSLLALSCCRRCRRPSRCFHLCRPLRLLRQKIEFESHACLYQRSDRAESSSECLLLHLLDLSHRWRAIHATHQDKPPLRLRLSHHGLRLDPRLCGALAVRLPRLLPHRHGGLPLSHRRFPRVQKRPPACSTRRLR